MLKIPEVCVYLNTQELWQGKDYGIWESISSTSISTY